VLNVFSKAIANSKMQFGGWLDLARLGQVWAGGAKNAKLENARLENAGSGKIVIHCPVKHEY